MLLRYVNELTSTKRSLHYNLVWHQACGERTSFYVIYFFQFYPYRHRGDFPVFDRTRFKKFNTLINNRPLPPNTVPLTAGRSLLKWILFGRAGPGQIDEAAAHVSGMRGGGGRAPTTTDKPGHATPDAPPFDNKRARAFSWPENVYQSCVCGIRSGKRFTLGRCRRWDTRRRMRTSDRYARARRRPVF